MFSNSKNNYDGETETKSQPSKRSGRAATSILSAGLKIDGRLKCEGDIQVDAEIDGNIESDMVTVGKSGIINGDLLADEVTISGRVVGDIRARNVKITGTAHVEGDIHHSALSVEPGAYVDGVCRRVDNPHATTGAAKRKAARSAQRKLSDSDNELPINGARLVKTEAHEERIRA